MNFEENANNFLNSLPQFIYGMNELLPSYQSKDGTIQDPSHNNQKNNTEEEKKITYEDNGIAISATSFVIGIM